MAVIKCLCIPILKYHSDTLSVSLPVVYDNSANGPFAFQWSSDEDCLDWSGSGSRSLLIRSGVLKDPPSLSLMIPDPVRLNIVDSSRSLRSLIIDNPSVSVRAVPPLESSVIVLDPVVRIVVVSILRDSDGIDSGISASIGSSRIVLSFEEVSLSSPVIIPDFANVHRLWSAPAVSCQVAWLATLEAVASDCIVSGSLVS